MDDGPTETRGPDGGRAKKGYALFVSSEAGVSAVPLGEKKELVVGRAADCDVPVADGLISRRHARLLLGDALALVDLGSKNGTKVRGRTLARGERAALAVGDVFELGSATFVLQWGQAAEAKPAPRAARPGEADVVLEDVTMRNLYALLDLLGPSPMSVLLLGETGVGKEVYARALHARSPRRDAAFVAIHCAALPDAMIEAELFGFERGAFTGAAQAKPGLLETADGGTAFLDEVGEIPLAAQAKLLRVVESGEIMRLGGVKPRRVDVRFVSATNRDPRAMIAAETFRADLFFRINGMSVTLPPLRDRRADIAPLARSFAQRTVTEAAIVMLEGYTWPGNVRELRAIVLRAALLAKGGSIDSPHLVAAEPEAFGVRTSPPALRVRRFATPAAPAKSTRSAEELRAELDIAEKERLQEALARAGGNQREAARILGISRYTLMDRMDRYGLTRPRKR